MSEIVFKIISCVVLVIIISIMIVGFFSNPENIKLYDELTLTSWKLFKNIWIHFLLSAILSLGLFVFYQIYDKGRFPWSKKMKDFNIRKTGGFK